MGLNEMRVSDLGILNINRKITGSRLYDKETIETVGSVNIFESTASGFNKSSYLHASDIKLSDEAITIAFTGNFAQAGTDQVAFLLKGENHSIALHFCDEQARLLIDDIVVIQFSYLQIKESEKIQALIKISKTNCTFTLNLHELIFEKSIDSNLSINLEDLTDLYIGNEPYELGNFWMGSINLSVFSISQNNEIVYTPSINYPLVFSRILLSDGEFKLNDKTEPIANHIFEFKISEITRSGSSILLATQIDDDSELIIKEIGLYISTAEGNVLFGSMSNLSINKGKGVPYDLILTINTHLSFVNVVGFPDYNSFYINEPDLCLFENFRTVKDVMLYAFTNYERIIDMNAMNIGYNRAQVFYKLQKDTANKEECYFTIENFVKLSRKLTRIVEVNFDPNVVLLNGNIIVQNNGEATNFSTTDYISGNILFDNENNWELGFAFRLKEEVTGTLITLRGPSVIQPLVFQARYSSEDNKTYFHALLGKNNTTDEFVVDADLFEIKPDEKYYIKFRYIRNNIHEEDSYYQLLISDDDNNYQEIFTKYSPRIILPVRSFSIGVKSDYNSIKRTFETSSPFKGIIYMNTLKIITNAELWTPTTESIINPTQLLQYYHMPDDINKSRYTVKDICNLEDYKITVTENMFQGDRNLVDFSDIDGFSLCVRVDLKDKEDKILLAKTTLTDKPYFLLSMLNQTLYFHIFTRTKTIILSKDITDEEMAAYLRKPIVLTIVIQGNKIILYNDTEVLTEFQGIFGTFRNHLHSFFTNYIQTDVLTDICSTMNLVISVEAFVEGVEENQGNYIKDILVIEGPLTLEEIHYINLLLND